jgi:hypothetical protein
VLHDLEVALDHIGADLEWVRPIRASRNHQGRSSRVGQR